MRIFSWFTGKQEPETLLAEVGATGLRQFSGYVKEEFHRNLEGSKAAKVYREMADNHPLIGAALRATEFLISRVNYRVDATGETPQHIEARDFIDGAINDMERSFSSVVTEATSMMTFGWAWGEKVFKLRHGDHPLAKYNSKFSDGKYGWRTFSFPAQESLLRWEFDENDDVIFLEQLTATGKSACIPRRKSLHFVMRQTKKNPEGKSLLRNAYTSYHHQKNLQFIEGVGIERNLAGLPIMTAPVDIMYPNASAEKRAIRTLLENTVQKIKADEMQGLVLPSPEVNGQKTGYDFKLVTSAGGSKAAEVDTAIKRYASWIAVSLMSDFMLLGTDKVGSFALSSDKTDLFALAVGSVLKQILDPFNNEAVPELLRLNNFNPIFAPVIKHSDLESPDLAGLSQYVSALINVGALRTDEALEDHLREAANLPAVAA